MSKRQKQSHADKEANRRRWFPGIWFFRRTVLREKHSVSGGRLVWAPACAFGSHNGFNPLSLASIQRRFTALNRSGPCD